MNGKGHLILSILFVGIAYWLFPVKNIFLAAICMLLGILPDVDLYFAINDKDRFLWHRFFLLHSGIIGLAGFLYTSFFIIPVTTDYLFCAYVNLAFCSHLILDCKRYKIVIIPRIFVLKGNSALGWIIVWICTSFGIIIACLTKA